MAATFVQLIDAAIGSPGTSLPATYSNNVGAGNLLVLSGCSQDFAITACSSTGGHNWTKAIDGGGGGANTPYSSIWYLFNAPAGATTVTVTFASSTSTGEIVCYEFTGIHPTTALDGTTPATATGTAGSFSTNSITIPNRNALLFTGTSFLGTPVAGPSSPWTVTQSTNSGYSAYRIAPSIGTYSASFQQNSSSKYACSLASFNSRDGTVVSIDRALVITSGPVWHLDQAQSFIGPDMISPLV